MAFVTPHFFAASVASRRALFSPATTPAAPRTLRFTATASTSASASASASSAAAASNNTLPSQYDALAQLTTIVEDTGDINAIATHRPHSATTNPTLVAAAAADPTYIHLVREAISYTRANSAGFSQDATLALVRNKLFTLFGAQILEHVPGDVSTEVDARLSFDTPAQIEVAEQIIALYEQVGIDRERVLIKLASTWEGIEACRHLEAKGIHTNMTLLFSLPQAAAAADAKAHLISPFVGRILDWYKKHDGVDSYAPDKDPGVISVRNIYDYYKCIGSDTIVMGASFRNKDEILQLAGCDRLTIAPKFINMLKECHDPLIRKLTPPEDVTCSTVQPLHMDERAFRWRMNEDAMATEKLAHGIRSFANDLKKLDRQLEQLMMTE